MNATDCSFTASRAVRFFVAIAAACAALGASAATYYWKPGTTQGQWTDLSNWSTESATGATASALPGSGDKFDAICDYNIDLCGETHQVYKMPEANGGFNDQHMFRIVNGTLKFSDDTRRHSGDITIDTGATLWMVLGSTLYTGVYANNQQQIYINNNGTLKVEGMLRLGYSAYNVQSGGSFILTPSAIRFSTSSENVYSDHAKWALCWHRYYSWQLKVEAESR